MRALANKAGTNDFGVILAVSKEKRFGFAARNYYASFLAVLEVLEEKAERPAGLKKFGTWTYDVVRAPFAMFAGNVVRTGLVDAATFDALNPALTPAALANKVPLPHGLSFRVPLGTGDAVLAALSALPTEERQRANRVEQATHVATGRQSLAAIAKKYKIDVTEFAERTGLAASAVPPRGTKLGIPAPIARYTLLPEARGMPMPVPAGPVLAAAPPVAAAATRSGPEKGADVDGGMPALSPAPSAAIRGLVTARVTRVESLGSLLGGVDVVAGAFDVSVDGVDVVTGVAPPRQRRALAPLVSAMDNPTQPAFSADRLR
jgi:hypothetical protein